MSVDHPLAAPTDGAVLDQFVRYFRLRLDPSDARGCLREIATAFARLPYENLTKIIKQAAVGDPRAARRDPREVVSDHIALGAGGTCFSLTATLLHLLRALGFAAEPILADRRYGANTHCALIVWLDGLPHLLDPGYLIVDPLPLGVHAPHQFKTSFNELRLVPHAGSDKLDLLTAIPGRPDLAPTYRLTFKTQPVDAGEFLRVWDESFDWDMMQYPVVTSVRDGVQRYLQGHRLQIRQYDRLERNEIPDEELALRIAREFGIAPEVVQRALRIVGR